MLRIPVYFVPGLGASPAIFENIQLNEKEFELFFLEWKIPHKGETLQEYAKRMTEDIKHKNPVLVGVSFGGILVQEMNKIISVRKTIIISSVKSNKELPIKMKFAKLTKIYKLFPTSILQNIEKYIPESISEKYLKGRKELYKMYLSVRDKLYLEWALEQVIMWNRETPDKNIIHIHGSNDEIFPIKYIQDCIVLEKGTHIMIINRYKWLNEKLPELIKN
ncbi:MAG: alpha/beta hydrolase [Flavobacteriaceae bacterium]